MHPLPIPVSQAQATRVDMPPSGAPGSSWEWAVPPPHCLPPAVLHLREWTEGIFPGRETRSPQRVPLTLPRELPVLSVSSAKSCLLPLSDSAPPSAPRGSESRHTSRCLHTMFTAVRFPTAKGGGSPGVHRWTPGQNGTHPRPQCYSALAGNEGLVPSHAGGLGAFLSEISQSQRDHTSYDPMSMKCSNRQVCRARAWIRCRWTGRGQNGKRLLMAHGFPLG